jgi:DNA-binding FrmR family transcriptional regulator
MTGTLVDEDRGAAVRHAQRAAGQVAGLASMITEGRPFADVVQQLLAVRGSLDSLLVRLVELQLRDCVPSSELRDEVDGLLRTALGRSAPGRGSPGSRRSRSTALSSDGHQPEGRTSP